LLCKAFEHMMMSHPRVFDCLDLCWAVQEVGRAGDKLRSGSQSNCMNKLSRLFEIAAQRYGRGKLWESSRDPNVQLIKMLKEGFRNAQRAIRNDGKCVERRGRVSTTRERLYLLCAHPVACMRIMQLAWRWWRTLSTSVRWSPAGCWIQMWKAVRRNYSSCMRPSRREC
jgi:hypothetical protein